jgi:CDGSH-type Zn-finger protein
MSGAPAVFDETAHPWVRPDRAPAAEIAATIDTCPSGALSYTRTDGAANGRRGRSATEDPAPSTARDPELAFFPEEGPSIRYGPLVSMTPLEDGPLEVHGPVSLTGPDGSQVSARRLSLCRCGQSGSKPNCDGTHVRVGFRAPGAPAPS